MKTNKIVKMAVEKLIVFFMCIQNIQGIFNPQPVYYNPTYSTPRSQFQEHQFLTGSPNHNSLLMLEAEDVLSKLEISCLGMLLCEIGFDSKAKIDDEIYLSLQESIGILQTILMKSNGGNILNYLVKANQLGLSSTDATICNFSSFQCKQRDLQPRTLCGVVKPICPVLKFSCRLCNFYLSSKSCRKTCQTFVKYCGSSGCNSSSIISDNNLDDCFTSDHFYGFDGSDVVIARVQSDSVEDCQLTCQSMDPDPKLGACQYFTLIVDITMISGQCILYNENHPKNEVWCPGFYNICKNGPRICKGPSPPRYLEIAGDIAGDGMDHQTTSSAEECAIICSNNIECCSIEYSASTKVCQLHKECVPSDPQFEDYIFYRKESCFKNGQYIGENEYPLLEKIPSAYACQKKCQELEHCKFWTFDNYNNHGYCHRYAVFDTPLDFKTCEPTFMCISGPESCQPEDYQCPTNYIKKYGDIDGWGIEHEQAASMETCAYRCTNRDDCCAFEFSHIKKMCQLHSECFPHNPPFEDYNFCQKTTGILCAQPGECTDSIFLALVAADDSMDCLNKCQSDDRCNFGTFRPSDLITNMCTFFQTCSKIETDLCPDCLTSSTKCSNPKCLISGLCSGTAQDAWYAFDQIACWSRCKTTDNCNWFSYDYDENMCSLFEICLEIDKSKLRYVSGKKECFVENTDKVLVTTGYSYPEAVASSEIISVGNVDITCQKFPDGPNGIHSATGGFVQNEVLICGGDYNSDPDSNCWILGQSKTIKMEHGRAYSYGIVLNDELWVTGGLTAETSSEFINLVRSRPATDELPWKFSYHCIAMMNSNENKVIMIGGKDFPERTLTVNWSNEDIFAQGPDLWQNGGRAAHSCTHIKHNNGSKYVIAAGGYNEESHYTSEILNVDDLTRGWYPGPLLMKSCTYGSFVTLSSGTEALLVGCETAEGDEDMIFKLTWFGENLEWEILPQKLNYPRQKAVAMLIPDSKTSCNKW